MKKETVQNHGNSPYLDITQKINTVKKISREEARKKIAEMRERDEEMVTGIFKNLENPAKTVAAAWFNSATKNIRDKIILFMNCGTVRNILYRVW